MQRLLQHFLWNFCTRQLVTQLYVKQIWFPPRPPFLKVICGGVCAAQGPFLASRPCGHMKQSRRVWRPVWACQVLLWTFSRSWRAFIPIQLLERKLAGMPSFASNWSFLPPWVHPCLEATLPKEWHKRASEELAHFDSEACRLFMLPLGLQVA